MARDKKFDFGSLMPQVDIVPPKAAAAAPALEHEKKAEVKTPPPIPSAPVTAPQTSTGTAASSSANDSLFMKPKKSTLKPASFTVYQEDLQEFKRINDELGYKDSEVIRILMRKYIDANRG